MPRLADLAGALVATAPLAVLFLAIASPDRQPLLSYGHLLGCLVLLADAASRPTRRTTGLAASVVYLFALPVQPFPGMFYMLFLLGLGADGVAMRAWRLSAGVYGAAVAVEDQTLLSARISGSLPDDTVFSFTYAGGWLLLVSLPAFAYLFHAAGRRVATLPAIAGFGASFAWHLRDPDLPRLAIGIGACLVWMVACAEPRPETRESQPGSAWVAGALVVGWALGHPRGGGPLPSGRVILLEGQYAAELPAADAPVRPEGASIGGFLRFLDRIGLPPVAPGGPLRPEMLEGSAAVLLCNLDRDLALEEIEAVQAYVEEGGRLWVFGDHTDIFGQMDPVNSLLLPYGIALRFDSAMPLDTHHWRGSLHAPADPWRRASPTLDALRVSVGASLRIDARARPLVMARAGFSDAGDRHAPERAFLGDWSWDAQNERIGDLVLVASAAEGRVLVAGDTAMLQDASFSESWRLVAALLGQSSRSALAAALGVALWAVGLLGAIRAGPLPAALALLVVSGWERFDAPLPRPRGAAWIDLAHGGDAETRGGEERGVDGLVGALSAAGYTPLFDRDAKARRDPDDDLVVLLPGRAPVGEAEAAALLAFASAGGRVLLGLDARSGAWEALLGPFGVSVSRRPLGACPEGSGGVRATFGQAWGLTVAGPACSTLAACWDTPVVVRCALGEGSVVAVGDPTFLFDEQLLEGDKYDRENVSFLVSAVRP